MPSFDPGPDPELVVLEDTRDTSRVTARAALSLDAAEPAEAPAPEAPAIADAPPVGLEACLSHVGVAVIETDPDGRVLTLNAAAERLTGFRAAEKLGAPLDEVFRIAPADPEDVGAALDPAEDSVLLERGDGKLIPIRHVVGRTAPASPGVPGRLVVFRDVNAEQLLTLQLARRARHDMLTGLLNRHAIAERVEQALAESRRTGKRHTLCYFDSTASASSTPRAATTPATICSSGSRRASTRSLCPSDAAARIARRRVRDPAHRSRRARRRARGSRRSSAACCEFRFAWGDKTFLIEPSLGLRHFGIGVPTPADGSSPPRATRAASPRRTAARASRSTSTTTTRWRRAAARSSGSRASSATSPRASLRLYAQTIHPLGARKDAGGHFEILMRVIDEKAAPHSPVGIIQAAENGRVMDHIDRFVVRKAFQTIGGLPRRALRKLELVLDQPVGDLARARGPARFHRRANRAHGVPPGKVCFEITETAALANLDEVRWLMQELGAMGCRFAIDDFGSGHASYGYIERLPVDYVKIDGMFVRT